NRVPAVTAAGIQHSPDSFQRQVPSEELDLPPGLFGVRRAQEQPEPGVRIGIDVAASSHPLSLPNLHETTASHHATIRPPAALHHAGPTRRRTRHQPHRAGPTSSRRVTPRAIPLPTPYGPFPMWPVAHPSPER